VDDPETIIAELRAVDTLIRDRKFERAQRDLARLTLHRDAPKHVDQFLEASEKLGIPDVIEALLSHPMPDSVRVAILFRLVDLYRRLGDRRNAFKKLMDLANTCTDSPTDLRKVSTYCVLLDEFAFALEIRERLLRRAPRDYSLALDVVEVRLRSNKARAQSELNEIMKAPDLESAAWVRASYLYGWLGDADSALRAINKAIELRDSDPWARYRLAAVLKRRGLTRRAREELTKLLVDRRMKPKELRMSGDLAFELPDRKLALRFAEAQYEREPADPECIIYFARHLRIAGDRDRAHHLLAGLFQAERRCPSLSDQQWVGLAEGLASVGDILLTKEAVAEAIARQPNSTIARALAAKTTLLERFGKPLSSTEYDSGGLKQERPGFFHRIGRIFRT
jgi:tetratricopeptide (TPR) repeat protein